jgi:hypothetical protein
MLPMHDQPTPDRILHDQDLAEHVILHLMLDEPAPGPWSTEELARVYGDPVQTADALASMHAMGVIHRHRQFVWPTRTAARTAQIEQRV